ncbi:hypothetical protein TNCV_4791241 [Trichonephila clavipes]|nr:hypothetical protein TNCV_4791241 [Trichonephila clavipes]
MFVSPLMIDSKAALESEKIASPSVVPESSRWVEYRMSASLIARSSLLCNKLLPLMNQQLFLTPLHNDGSQEKKKSKIYTRHHPNLNFTRSPDGSLREVTEQFIGRLKARKTFARRTVHQKIELAKRTLVDIDL